MTRPEGYPHNVCPCRARKQFPDPRLSNADLAAPVTPSSRLTLRSDDPPLTGRVPPVTPQDSPRWNGEPLHHFKCEPPPSATHPDGH